MSLGHSGPCSEPSLFTYICMGNGTMISMLYTVWEWDNDIHAVHCMGMGQWPPHTDSYLIVSVTVYLGGVSCSDMNLYYKVLISIARNKLNPEKGKCFIEITAWGYT